MMSGEQNLTELIEQSDTARARQDWLRGEEINQAILLQMRGNKKFSPRELVKIANRYLSSIFGQGLFLFEANHPDKEKFKKKVEEFRLFIKSNKSWKTSLEGTERDLHEVELFLRVLRADTRNKAANSLRRLGRPDLSVKLCDFLLSNSKLNYYVLISRSWAYGDLGQIDEAIDDAKRALKHHPKISAYPQIALSRAHRQRFKRDGDLDDAEIAIKWAREALTVKRNFHAAIQLVASLIAAGVERENIEIKKLEIEFPNILRSADKVAIESATEVVFENAYAPLEDIEEFIEDLEDLEVEISDNRAEDYFEDYFPELIDSLNDPRSPHLEP